MSVILNLLFYKWGQIQDRQTLGSLLTHSHHMHFAGGDLWGVTGRQRIPTQPLEPLTRQQSRDCSVFLVAPPVLAPSSQAEPSRPAPRPDGTLLQPSLPLIVPCSLLLHIFLTTFQEDPSLVEAKPSALALSSQLPSCTWTLFMEPALSPYFPVQSALHVAPTPWWPGLGTGRAAAHCLYRGCRGEGPRLGQWPIQPCTPASTLKTSQEHFHWQSIPGQQQRDAEATWEAGRWPPGEGPSLTEKGLRQPGAWHSPEQPRAGGGDLVPNYIQQEPTLPTCRVTGKERGDREASPYYVPALTKRPIVTTRVCDLV